jgi:hypothetical protein
MTTTMKALTTNSMTLIKPQSIPLIEMGQRALELQNLK